MKPVSARLAQLPARVRVVEVGPRDGLQNETTLLSTTEKLELIRALVAAGHEHIEVAAFVRPDLVPAMADADDLCRRLEPAPGVVYSALVPNERGLERALAAGLRHIAVLTAASEGFCRRNLGCSVSQSLERVAQVLSLARQAGAANRAYISTAFFCPYEGRIPVAAVGAVARQLREAGAQQVVLADTVGRASPDQVVEVIEEVCAAGPPGDLALHLHDTRNRGLANAFAGLLCGVGTLDSSVGGLGGCPFAPGASGNLSTELLLELLSSMGLPFAPSADRHASVAESILKRLERAPASPPR